MHLKYLTYKIGPLKFWKLIVEVGAATISDFYGIYFGLKMGQNLVLLFDKIKM